jgi:hypothetical protein
MNNLENRKARRLHNNIEYTGGEITKISWSCGKGGFTKHPSLAAVYVNQIHTHKKVTSLR